VTPAAEPKAVRIVTWIFTGYFTLNAGMNLFLSNSLLEKAIMTPVSLLLAICFFLVSRS